MSDEWTNADIDRHVINDFGFIQAAEITSHDGLLATFLSHDDDDTPGCLTYTTIHSTNEPVLEMDIHGLCTPMSVLQLPRYAEVMQLLEVGGVPVDECYISDAKYMAYKPLSADDYLFSILAPYSPFCVLVPTNRIQVHENGFVDLKVRTFYANKLMRKKLTNSGRVVYKHFIFSSGCWFFDTCVGGGGGTKGAIVRQTDTKGAK